MNNNITKVKFFKLIIYSILIVVTILSLKSYYYYEDIKETVIIDAKKQADLLRDYMMSVRKVYHKQFLSSEIELTDKTLGFLPAHATTLISDEFQKRNKYNYYIRNVSDRPRNPRNMADIQEMKAIDFFNKFPQESEYFKKYKYKDKEYFQYAAPIRIEQYCLNCHGKREDALPTIRDRYTTAYDYKLGDLRGIVSIKIPNENMTTRLYSYMKKELLLSFLALVLIAIIFIIIFRKFSFQIRSIETTALDFASTDSLTGLYNRRYLKDFSFQHQEMLKKYDSFIVAFLDIDHFKQINDTYGHDVGDVVLREFASLLLSLSRKEDVVCRYGGEEFLIIAYGMSLTVARDKFEKIREALENRKIEVGNLKISITVSIGIAAGNKEEDLEEIISNADKALYRAKADGRNVVKVYHPVK